MSRSYCSSTSGNVLESCTGSVKLTYTRAVKSSVYTDHRWSLIVRWIVYPDAFFEGKFFSSLLNTLTEGDQFRRHAGNSSLKSVLLAEVLVVKILSPLLLPDFIAEIANVFKNEHGYHQANGLRWLAHFFTVMNAESILKYTPLDFISQQVLRILLIRLIGKPGEHSSRGLCNFGAESIKQIAGFSVLFQIFGSLFMHFKSPCPCLEQIIAFLRDHYLLCWKRFVTIDLWPQNSKFIEILIVGTIKRRF